MIRGVHTMFYSSQPEELRAFLRDKLGFPCTDVGGGWLIFAMPDADMGVHPTEPGHSPPTGTHNISFYCDDIGQTVEDLKARGVEFTQPVRD
ncbi:MAG TPA: VOC family protein, partial [Pirellulaceae bacterium]|nr:VOC family protein [Pirellulaceae bacterium]